MDLCEIQVEEIKLIPLLTPLDHITEGIPIFLLELSLLFVRKKGFTTLRFYRY